MARDPSREDRVFYANGWAPFLQRPELLQDVSDRLYCVSDAVPKGGAARAAEVFNASLTKIFMGPAGALTATPVCPQGVSQGVSQGGAPRGAPRGCKDRVCGV